MIVNTLKPLTSKHYTPIYLLNKLKENLKYFVNSVYQFKDMRYLNISKHLFL